MSADNSRWIWVRHFPTNASGIYVGQTDLPAIVPPACSLKSLNMQALPAETVWLASPLIRAQQTIRWLKQSLALPDNEFVTVPELMEQNFGAWEGQRYDSVSQQMDCSQAENIKPTQGESFTDVTARIHEWLVNAMEKYAGRTVVAVCHAGPIRAALAHALVGTPAQALRFQLDYASMTKMTYFQYKNSWNARIDSVNLPLMR